MLRILYVQPISDLYGSSRALITLLKYLPRDQFEAHVALPSKGPIQREIRASEASVHLVPCLAPIGRRNVSLALPMRALRGSVELIRVIRRFNIDIVHSNSAVVLTGALAACLTGHPHVWHVRENFCDFPQLWRSYSRLIHALSTRVLVPSLFCRDQFRNQKKILVIPDFLDPDRLPSSGYSGSSGVIGCVGRLNTWKGQELAISMMKYLNGYELVLVGDGIMEVRLKTLCRELGVADTVRFLGFREDVLDQMALLEVLVATPRYAEPFGLVFLEAMSMGLPVATFKAGGPAEILDEERSLFFTSRDPQEMADQLHRFLVEGKGKLHRAKAKLPQKYLPGFAVPQFVKMYQELGV